MTIGNSMGLTRKILTYLSWVSYFDTRNKLLIVIKTIQKLILTEFSFSGMTLSEFS